MTLIKTDCRVISQFRKQVMGIAAIAIILCHAVRPEVLLPDQVGTVLLLGRYGVDIFIFLSGFSMSYSANRIVQGGVIRWYKSRFVRLLVPTLMIVIPLRMVICAITGESFFCILWFLTTIPFWTDHNGDWFIIITTIAYLMVPFLGVLYKKSKNGILVTIFLTLVFTAIGNSFFGLISIKSSIYDNIKYIASRIPSFFVGYYVGLSAQNGKRFNLAHIAVGPILAIVLRNKVEIRSGWLIAFALVLLLSMITQFLAQRMQRLNNTLLFFGGISLESYLMNVYLGDVIKCTNVHLVFNGYLYYSLVISIGISGAVVVHKLSEKAIKNLLRN